MLTLAVVVVLLVRLVAANRTQVSRSLQLLSHPKPIFIVLALGAEALSYLSYATAQQRLAGATGHRIGRGWLACLAVSAQALIDFVPAGYLAGNVLNFRELRRRSLPVAHCAWLLGMTSLLYIGALLGLACAGAAIDVHGGWLPRLLGSSGMLVLASAAMTATTRGGGGARRLRPAALATLAWLERRRGITARIAVSSRDVAQQMSEARLTRSDAAIVAASFAASWLSDAGCLACGFAALGVPLPWDSLLVAYAVAQLLSFLPVSPGGFGLVEGTLTVTLTLGGRGVSSVLASVLFYRAVSYWAILPAGALAYGVLRRAHHARRDRSPAAASNSSARISQ